MKHKSIFVAIMACMITMAGCASKQENKPNVGDITESSWGLIALRSANDSMVEIQASKEKPTLKVTNDGSVTGSSCCNSFKATVALTGHSLQFGDFVSTHITCPDSTLERTFFKSLLACDNYTIHQSRLLLKKGEKVIATFIPLDFR
jgi:heat shock protein HslJ